MTDDQRLSAIIDSWLVEGPKKMPDRVVDVVADRISHQSQRPVWRFPGRELHMPTYPRIAAAVAAIAILAIGGIYLFGQPGGSGIGGPAATQSPSPSAVSTPTASPTQISSFLFTPRVTVQAPAGWSVDGDGPRSVGLKPPAGPGGPGAGSILVMSGPFVGAKDPDCQNRPAVGGWSNDSRTRCCVLNRPRRHDQVGGYRRRREPNRAGPRYPALSDLDRDVRVGRGQARGAPPDGDR